MCHMVCVTCCSPKTASSYGQIIPRKLERSDNLLDPGAKVSDLNFDSRRPVQTAFGIERIKEDANLIVDRAVKTYKKGLSGPQIQARIGGVVSRHLLTDVWDERASRKRGSSAHCPIRSTSRRSAPIR